MQNFDKPFLLFCFAIPFLLSFIGTVVYSADNSNNNLKTVYAPAENNNPSSSFGIVNPLPVEELSCWFCNATDESDGCFNLTEDFRTNRIKQKCQSHEKFCRVERVWYIFGKGKSEYNFSIYRSCKAICDPFCVIMGDRTKVQVHSCATCCTEPFCNVGSSGKIVIGNINVMILILGLTYIV